MSASTDNGFTVVSRKKRPERVPHQMTYEHAQTLASRYPFPGVFEFLRSSDMTAIRQRGWATVGFFPNESRAPLLSVPPSSEIRRIRLNSLLFAVFSGSTGSWPIDKGELVSDVWSGEWKDSSAIRMFYSSRWRGVDNFSTTLMSSSVQRMLAVPRSFIAHVGPQHTLGDRFTSDDIVDYAVTKGFNTYDDVIVVGTWK